ncbi:hydrogenase accessory protein [Sagittula stellata]|uniref:HupG hydrogenase expression/formation protein n=1 Tax=Sagittula stellata (strain ATCC 700073 / DSM 11524 / E-37) TaxID=388399 RepID=A3KAF1_SAGS3|nr:hydrogenase accessory protein [Sagittula stellata]EBA05810.1 HupG hydrogenase expression/formation protein [Sagittula stellata E-37]
MSHPLITRLTTEFGWPRFEDMGSLEDWRGGAGAHVLFVPGDPARNLETADVAVILPELRQAFQGRFDCAVCGDAIEEQVRNETKVFKTPSLIFWRAGEMIGAVPKVRDWDDYMARVAHILSLPVAAE